MIKTVIPVPAMIRYLSQWKDFKLSNLQGHNILHKQLPGCGFTEFALTCPENVVLSSPRRMLMENKKEQHGEDVYLVVNEWEADSPIDADISKPLTSKQVEEEVNDFMKKLNAQVKNADTLYDRLFHEIYNYIGRMNQEGKPSKIIVTYDSTYIVKQILESIGICDTFFFCIDEFQSILEDSRFKSSVEVEFLSILQSLRNVCYVSATPMLDKYLERIDELSEIPYYILDWGIEDKLRIRRPQLKVRSMHTVGSKMEEIIQSYLDGKFEKVLVERNGQYEEVESREAVFYVNSVNHIINIIKRMELSADQVNILCSKTPDNQRRIQRKLGKKSGHCVGSVPLKGQSHKMFTFCTRTVYLGADFYSTNARSFVFSDANADCLSVDVGLDLYQILGRQRLEENPWKNSAEFYYIVTSDARKKTAEDFQNIIDKKTKKTNNLLDVFETCSDKAKQDLAETYQYVARSNKYRDNYVAVNRRVGTELQPVFNNLVMINEQRAFDIQQVDYADRIAVFNSLEDKFDFESGEQIIKTFFEDYSKVDTWVERIHMIVDFILDNPEYEEAVINNLVDSDKIKQQLKIVGAKKIKGLGYHITKIQKAMGITIFDKSQFLEEVYSEFIPGQRYTNKFIKEKLGEIYKAMDYAGTPKASDLEEWFDITPCKITILSKREHGLEILKRK